MNTNTDLDKIISQLGLSKEDYLFLTIKTVYLYEMKSGEKNVEYREPGNFILSRLYKNYNKKGTSEPKQLSHILFQAGYNPDSPRMLIELQGWVFDEIKYPAGVSIANHNIDRYSVNLLLGKIIYENLDMSREQEFLRKESGVQKTDKKQTTSAGRLEQIHGQRKVRIKRSICRG